MQGDSGLKWVCAGRVPSKLASTVERFSFQRALEKSLACMLAGVLPNQRRQAR